VSLGANRARFTGELNERNQSPRAIHHRVTGAPGVVHRQSSLDAGGQSDVIPLRSGDAAQEIG